MPKKRDREEQDWYTAQEDEARVCPLCERTIGPGDGDDHHLIPQQKGGKGGPVAYIHRFCHTKIHATLSNYDLAKFYPTIELLREHPEIAKFVAWVHDKPSSFYMKNDRHGDRKKGKYS